MLQSLTTTLYQFFENISQVQSNYDLNGTRLDNFQLLSSENVFLLPVAVYAIYLVVHYIEQDLVLSIANVSICYLLAGMTLHLTGYTVLGNLLACAGIYIHWKSLKSVTLSSNGKAILVTGCDRGIGHELVKALDRQGYQVFAGCLYKGADGEQELAKATSGRVHTLQLDVCQGRQIKQAAAEVEIRLGNNKLWAVVNNAGICYVGNIEIMSEEDMEKILDINLKGPIKICRTFLPMIRKSKGRIVNVASNAGLAPIPLMGVYCASKSALATLTEVLRYELQTWGVHVATIIPSGYKTGILAYDERKAADRWWRSASETVKEDYGRDCFTRKFKHANYENQTSPDLTPIVNKILHAVSAKSPYSFYYSGLLARALPFLYAHLPLPLCDPTMKLIGDWFEFKPVALTNCQNGK